MSVTPYQGFVQIFKVRKLRNRIWATRLRLLKAGLSFAAEAE